MKLSLVSIILSIGMFSVLSTSIGEPGYERFMLTATAYMEEQNKVSFKDNYRRAEKIALCTWGFSVKHKVDPYLTVAVMWRENNFRNIRGSDGEIGYMQIKPGTAEFMHRVKGDKPPNDVVTKLELDVCYNIEMGVRYLAYTTKISGGNPGVALLSYNVGHGKITGYINPITEELKELKKL